MVDKKSATSSVLRQLNEARIIELLRTQGPLSRTDLARGAPMAKATVSRIVSDLEERDLVKPIGEGDSRRGPKPLLYEFNAQAYVAVGIDVTREECVVVVTDLDATPVMRLRRVLGDTAFESFLQTLDALFAEIHEIYPDRIVGVGLGVPGVYDDDADRLIQAENLGWRNIPLKKILAPRMKTQLHVVNRANAATLAEKWYGSGQGYNHVLYVSIESGIGSGIILNDELYEGANGSAGELGHITVAPDGAMCTCGKRGCLETVASTTAIIRNVSMQNAGLLHSDGDTEVTALSLAMQAAADASHPANTIVTQILRDAGQAIGIAVASAINILNPQIIVVGGLASYAPSFFIKSIEQRARTEAFKIAADAATIVTSSLGDEAVATGAAALLLSTFFGPHGGSLANSAASWNTSQGQHAVDEFAVGS